MTSVAVIMLTYFCANILLGLGLLKRHEDLVAQREKHEQFARECEERMKKWECKYPDVAEKGFEEKMNKVEPIIFREVYDVNAYRDEQGRLMRIGWSECRLNGRDAWKED